MRILIVTCTECVEYYNVFQYSLLGLIAIFTKPKYSFNNSTDYIHIEKMKMRQRIFWKYLWNDDIDEENIYRSKLNILPISLS